MAEENPDRLDEHQIAFRIIIFATFGVFGAVILLYLRTLVGDSGLFVHPREILRALENANFLRGFGVMLLQILLSSLIGVAIGVAMGALILRSGWLSQAALRFLRVGLWLPFFVFWALPIWRVAGAGETESFFRQVVVKGSVAAFPAVMLSTCYHFLSARLTLGLRGAATFAVVAREAVLLALLISLLFQIWFAPYGWNWFPLPKLGSVAGLYAAMILLAAFAFLVNRLFGATFDATARMRKTLLLAHAAGNNQRSFLGAGALLFICVGAWQLLSMNGKVLPLLSPPIDTIEAAYRLVVAGSRLPNMMDSTLWRHVYVSLMEIAGGLVLGGGVALAIYEAVRVSVPLRKLMEQLLPLSYVSLVVLPFFVIVLIRQITVFDKITTVAALSFYPLIRTLWGLADRPLFGRLLFALDDALPFAFLGMLFGEVMAATAGLGFFLVFAGADLFIAETLAAALLTFLLLIAISLTLQWSAKQLYFQDIKRKTVPA